jgi:ATP-dependent RNA helicase DDX1
MEIWKKLPKDKGMQVVICSATLHSPEITELADAITQHPTWVDLKGKDSVPETVDHAVILADPVTDTNWKKVVSSIPHDNIHLGLNPNGTTPDCYSLGAKVLKLQIFVSLLSHYLSYAHPIL